MTTEHQVRALLAEYGQALDESDADLAASCFADDGLLMAPGLPTVRGNELKHAYGRLFDLVRLEVVLEVDEVGVTGPDSAHALTRSSTTRTDLATGERTSGAERGLVLLVQERGQWRIRRYLSNQAG